MRILLSRVCSKRLSFITSVCFCVFLACSICAFAGSNVLDRIHWPTTQAEISQQNSMYVSEVEALVNSLTLGAHISSLKVQEFRFVFLEPQKVYLVATIDSSGRGLYFGLMVIGPPGSYPRFITIDSAPPHLLASELLDLDGKGVDVIVRKELVGLYRGSQSGPLFWYSIERLDHGVLKDVSQEYAKFYMAVFLPRLSFIEGALTAEKEGSEQRVALYLAKTAYLQFRYERVIAGQQMAGLAAAKKWKDSSDPEIQMLAVETFEEMRTPEATSLLRQMVGSTNSMVSEAARMAIEKVKSSKNGAQ